MVRDKVDEAEWKYLDVNEHWQQMKNIMMETAQDICALSKDHCRYKERWWWNEEAAEAVREKKIKYGNWKRENLTENVFTSEWKMMLIVNSSSGSRHSQADRQTHDDS